MRNLFPLILVGAISLPAQSHELSMTTGYNYQNSDQGNEGRANLNGWFADLQYDLSSHVGITGEVDSYYGSLQGEALGQQNFVAGPQFTFRDPEAKVRPFFYAQTGDQRSSSAGSITHSFNFQIGTGVEIKLQARIRFQITIAEYNLAVVSGTSAQSYGLKTGLIWTLWKQK
jgi:hypothetical protein